uniref:HAT C-terminal dimerisation domain-containing protein n=1 Tax=Lactuca sativa TaxID=4236 RepID=A0A9R1V746_LACSA|nr:hypothetical protein LSAT_V11C600339980 [Lactuca sativa]
MLEIAHAYEKTFERYDLEEFDFRNEIEKAGLSIPSSRDWESVRNVCHFLKPFHDVTLRISLTLYLTSNTCIKDIYSIRTLMDEAISDSSLCDIALAMKNSFSKFYFKYCRVYHSSSILGKCQNPDFMAPKPPLRNKLREKMKTNIVESIGELEKYLQESVEDDSKMFNILDWWKVSSPIFPILSLMAKDVFAILVSTMASESVFSTSGRFLDPFRSSLTPKIVESLICTQDWIQGSISDTIDYEKDWEENQQIDKDLSKIM